MHEIYGQLFTDDQLSQRDRVHQQVGDGWTLHGDWVTLCYGNTLLGLVQLLALLLHLISRQHLTPQTCNYSVTHQSCNVLDALSLEDSHSKAPAKFKSSAKIYLNYGQF